MAGAKAKEAVQALRAQRDETLGELLELSDEECGYVAQWAGTDRTINFLLRAYAFHEIDHLQHVTRLLRGRNRHLSEAQLLLARAQALRGEMEAVLLSLSDEEFEAEGPDGGWSGAKVAEHLVQTDRTYLANARRARQERRKPAPPSPAARPTGAAAP